MCVSFGHQSATSLRSCCSWFSIFFVHFFFEPRPWLSYPTRKWEKTSFSTKMPRAGGTGHWPCRMVEVAASLGISSLKDSDSGQDPLLPCIYIYTRHPPAFWLTYRPATLRGLYASLSWGIHKLPGGAGFWAISRWYCLKSGTSTQIFASLELHGLSWQKTSIAWYSNRFGWVAPWEMWSDKLVAHRGVETAHPFNFVAPHLWGDFLEILSTLLGLYLENPGNFTAWDAKKGRCSGSWVVPCAGLHGFMACYVRPRQNVRPQSKTTVRKPQDAGWCFVCGDGVNFDVTSTSDLWCKWCVHV